MPVAQRRVRIEPVMGTVIAIDLRDHDVPEAAIDATLAWLHEVDHRFSTYQADSEISRLGRGELTVDECHADVATVLSLCEDLRAASGGAFNAWRARPDGRLDPSGVVKGWAVEMAAGMLAHAGARNFSINAGGDVIARGCPEAGRSWRVGIRHPHNPDAVAVVVDVTDMAVATSGSYERGRHILDARSGEPADGLLGLTVAGPSLTLADAYATAGFAMGKSGIGWAAAHEGYAAYGITATGHAFYSDAFAALIVT
ncbi:MAG: FAD:protein FMN transferase [Chloroflexi bacterium]|nr:MAG: FAD:protein FMN transferase [Chloroflexota bacterium]